MSSRLRSWRSFSLISSSRLSTALASFKASPLPPPRLWSLSLSSRTSLSLLSDCLCLHTSSKFSLACLSTLSKSSAFLRRSSSWVDLLVLASESMVSFNLAFCLLRRRASAAIWTMGSVSPSELELSELQGLAHDPLGLPAWTK